jgi:hypothetical protein
MPSPLHLHLGECLPRSVFPTRRDGRFREFPGVLLFVSLLLCMICTSCGAVGSGPAPPVTVTVLPNSAQPFPGVNVPFHAVVENASSSAVDWQVNQAPGGNATVGTITPNGDYTAPNSVPNPATVTVTAVLHVDSTKTGSASVTIQSLSAIQGLTLSPRLSSVTTSQTLQLNVFPDVVSNTDVTWAVDGISNGNPTVGTISTSGVPSNSVNYSPPSTAGSHTITAKLKANPGAIGSATVEVTDFPGTLTWRNDNSRSGVNSQELVLAPGPGPGAVNSSTFGKLFSCTIDGYAYAQPLYVPNLPIPGKGTHNVVFVATENDSVYAFDADVSPCKQLWKTSLIPAGSEAIALPILNMVGTDIAPFVGITGTPVIDGSTSTLYVVAATQTIAGPLAYVHSLYALDLATGQREIQPAGVGIATLDIVFPSWVENQRPALLLDNGTVYIAFGSYGGQCVVETAGVLEKAACLYHGWLFGYDSSSLQQTRIFNVTPLPAIQGGIWQSGGGPSADSNHNVFVVTGDGPFDVNHGGSSYSNSFLRLGTSGGLSVSDYFTPCNVPLIEPAPPGGDPNMILDIGASAPVLLQDSAGSRAQPHLLIGGSNGGSLYIVDRDNMGKSVDPCPDSPARVQTIPVGAGAILSTPLFWNNAVYVAPGNGNFLMSFPMSGGILSPTPSVSQSPETLGPQGATPVISSNGTSNAILWLIDSSGALTNMPAILRAFDPNNLSKEIYHSAMAAASPDTAGPAVKFTVPTVANGKVYVGTQTELDVYGLLQ